MDILFQLAEKLVVTGNLKNNFKNAMMATWLLAMDAVLLASNKKIINVRVNKERDQSVIR